MPLDEFGQHRAFGFLHNDGHCHCVAGNPARNEGTGNHPACARFEVDRIRKDDNVEFVVGVTARSNGTGSDHRPAARFA